MKTKIYVLCEPDGTIRYVGKTKHSLNARLSGHFWAARRSGKNHCRNWIRSILHTGHLPTISLIGEVEGDGSNEERAWIVYGRAEGWRLVNQTDGGEGASGRVVSIKEHQARSMTAKKHLCSKESRLKSNRTRTGQKRSIDARLKMSKARAGKKPWIMGKHHSIKSCLKMSERRKGIVPWNKGLKEKK